jgi:hypothetical protein
MEAKDLLSEKVARNTKGLFKSFLILMEDLHADHQISFGKLKKHLPGEAAIIDQANYFDQDKLQYLRKKILDMGNETVRESNTNLEKFTIDFRFRN